MRTSHKVTHFLVALAAFLTLTATSLAQAFTSTVANPAVSDQKAGSVLVFPYYNSTVSGGLANTNDTLITITNVSNGAPFTNGVQAFQYLHLFFIDGSNCSPADTYACLTPNGSIQILASVYDPNIKGYLIAIAVNANGVPIDANNFIGNAFVRNDTDSIIGNYGAEAFVKITGGAVTTTNGNATLSFDGTDYESAPTQFSVQLQALTSSALAPYTSDQSIILASVSGDLGSKLNVTGPSGMGVIYKDDETPASFTSRVTAACLLDMAVNNTNFRVVPGSLTSFLSGHYGYVKMNVSSPAVGLIISKHGIAGSPVNRFSGIRTLHKTTVGTATITAPVFSPYCQY